jgi:hypothetical protein
MSADETIESLIDEDTARQVQLKILESHGSLKQYR